MIFEENITAALRRALTRNDTTLESVLRDNVHGVYVVGKNDQSLEIISRYKVLGLIDDFNKSERSWNGIPVVGTNDIAVDSVVINCATSISPRVVLGRLRAAGLVNIFSVSDLLSEAANLIALPWFVEQQRREWAENGSWWREFHSLLCDDTSKKTLVDVLSFRLTADPNYMSDYTVRLKDQYFDDFMQYSEEVFVDAGGFDGDTTEEFVNRYPDYKKVYIFEPSIKNLNAAKRRLLGRRDISFIPLGLSDRRGSLRFNADAGSASAVGDSYCESISVVTLDEELEDVPISFIKMDLEGWELNALRGSQLTIKRNKPKLAIAVYHSAKDFREIPQYLLKINPDYKVYLRHYTQGWSETVMFFV